MDQLTNTRILITGGAGDIGTAMAVAVASRGAAVTLADIKSVDEAKGALEIVAAEASRSTVRYVQMSTTDRAAVNGLFRESYVPDIVIANAGIVESAPFLEITPRQWDTQIEVNLTGTFNVIQAAAKAMVSANRAGHIIVISSWVQDVPWPEIAAYSTSKAGLRMLARSAARELATRNIRVNVIAPGIVNAGMAKQQIKTEPQYAARVAGIIPLGELQTAQQVGDVVAFLCSDAADYMTGSVVLADGGCSLFQFDAM